MRVHGTGLALAVCIAAACSQQDTKARSEPVLDSGPAAAVDPVVGMAPDRTPRTLEAEPSSESSKGWVEYPSEIRGQWVERETGCPINYDGESFLSIEADLMGQYENTSRARHVEVVGTHPPTWRIELAYSPGTGEHDGADPVMFMLDGPTLVIGTGAGETAYIRCE